MERRAFSSRTVLSLRTEGGTFEGWRHRTRMDGHRRPKAVRLRSMVRLGIRRPGKECRGRPHPKASRRTPGHWRTPARRTPGHWRTPGHGTGTGAAGHRTEGRRASGRWGAT